MMSMIIVRSYRQVGFVGNHGNTGDCSKNKQPVNWVSPYLQAGKFEQSMYQSIYQPLCYLLCTRDSLSIMPSVKCADKGGVPRYGEVVNLRHQRRHLPTIMSAKM